MPREGAGIAGGPALRMLLDYMVQARCWGALMARLTPPAKLAFWFGDGSYARVETLPTWQFFLLKMSPYGRV
jgi:hypothetical protein